MPIVQKKVVVFAEQETILGGNKRSDSRTKVAISSDLGDTIIEPGSPSTMVGVTSLESPNSIADHEEVEKKAAAE